MVRPPKKDPFVGDGLPDDYGGKIKTTKWHGEKMLKMHSLLAACRTASNIAMARELSTHNIIGTMSSGKSTLAESIAHCMHEIMNLQHKTSMAVHMWGEDELLNIDEALHGIKSNSVITFDDISYVQDKVSNRTWKGILSTITKIRHRGMGDVRVVLIFNFHYSRGLDKFLRGADFHWITSMGSNEIDNYTQLFGKGSAAKLRFFERTLTGALNTGRWGPTDPLGKKERMYKYHKPFAPCLFYDKSRLRTVAYPLRQWINGKCGICNEAMGVEHEGVDLSAVFDPIYLDHGTHTITAARAWLMARGVNPYGRGTQQAMNRIENAAENHNVRPKDVLAWVEAKNEASGSAARARRRQKAKELAAATDTEIAESKVQSEAPAQ